MDPPEQYLGAELPDGRRILGNDRYARFEEIGQREIVETDQGGAVLQACRTKGPNRADRYQVLSAEQCRGRIGSSEQSGRGGLGRVDRMKIVPDQAVIGFEPGFAPDPYRPDGGG